MCTHACTHTHTLTSSVYPPHVCMFVYMCLGIIIVSTRKAVLCEALTSYAEISQTMSIFFGLRHWILNKSVHFQLCFWIPDRYFRYLSFDPKVLVHMTRQYNMRLIFNNTWRLAKSFFNWNFRFNVTATLNGQGMWARLDLEQSHYELALLLLSRYTAPV